jgi:hypothetical protein
MFLEASKSINDLFFYNFTVFSNILLYEEPFKWQT